MPVTIRPATPDDLPAILEIEREAANAAHWSRQVYEKVIDAGVVLVADENGNAVGFICAREVAAEWEIENVVVAESSRRQGIAGVLLTELLERIRGRAGRAVHLEVRESNCPARRLYEKHGFTLAGRRRGYYQQPREDAILYSLGLDEQQ